MFPPPGIKPELEKGTTLTPKFNAEGLLPCIATNAETGDVVMFAYMNAEALSLSLETGIAHYWSRSRGAIWKKGETSGELQKIIELRTDCDQDTIWIKVKSLGRGAACHLGFETCFYRVAELPSNNPAETKLLDLKLTPLFDPNDVY